MTGNNQNRIPLQRYRHGGNAFTGSMNVLLINNEERLCLARRRVAEKGVIEKVNRCRRVSAGVIPERLRLNNPQYTQSAVW